MGLPRADKLLFKKSAIVDFIKAYIKRNGLVPFCLRGRSVTQPHIPKKYSYSYIFCICVVGFYSCMYVVVMQLNMLINLGFYGIV